jgi:diadenosine tetraphosphate (Ap4A) HIT family hydrolase
MAHSDPNCIFCKIIAGQIPCFKLAEDDHALAFLDIGPLSRGHSLVIPKEHAEKVHQLSPASMAHVGPMISRVAAALGTENYNVLQNNGRLAHQEVMHVHFHILPKDAESGLEVMWPTLTGDKKPSMEELGKMAESIRAKLH